MELFHSLSCRREVGGISCAVLLNREMYNTGT